MGKTYFFPLFVHKLFLILLPVLTPDTHTHKHRQHFSFAYSVCPPKRNTFQAREANMELIKKIQNVTADGLADDISLSCIISLILFSIKQRLPEWQPNWPQSTGPES